ncbi:unnamed protein product [Haemonchus placei]|uniref:Uncharacterized protein n=1 Tax=Haemonchus placei TaxID=6290 RepID=A0A0N4X481_HAEPC|nr:unnamed protein product [Haemonchus placei]
MDTESSLRRSLRRINPFRNKIFRLPATPRLARNRKCKATFVLLFFFGENHF